KKRHFYLLVWLFLLSEAASYCSPFLQSCPFGCLLLRCFSLYQVSAWLILHPFHLACSDRGKRQEAPQHFLGSCLLPAVRLFLHSSELPAIIPLYQWRL